MLGYSIAVVVHACVLLLVYLHTLGVATLIIMAYTTSFKDVECM